MDPMLAEFATVASTVDYREPVIPVVSTMTGRLATAGELGGDHWVRHARAAVRFSQAVDTMVAQGVRTFLEVGPDGVLAALAGGVLAEVGDGRDRSVIATTRRDRAQPETVAAAVAGLHARGVTVDWEAYFAAFDARLVDLPTYAFQRERYALVVDSAAGRTAQTARAWQPAAPVPVPRSAHLAVLDLGHGTVDLPDVTRYVSVAELAEGIVSDPVDAVLLPLAVHAAAASDESAEDRYARTHDTLDLIQGFSLARLVVVTFGVADQEAGDGAVAWKLLASAQAQNPERVVLADFDGDSPDPAVVGAVLDAGIPVAVVRGETILVPALPPIVSERTREPERSDLADQVAAAPVARHRPIVLAAVRAEIAAVLRRGNSADIDDDRAFQDLGFDSLTAIDLRNRLSAATGMTLSATAVFDHPTLAALTDHVLSEMRPEDDGRATPVRAELDRLEGLLPQVERGSDGEEIAARLRTMLSWLTEREAPTRADDLSAEATTDEIFAFIDNELGRSAG